MVLLVMAAIGGALLAIIVVLFWQNPGDNYAYWLAAERLVAGQPVYVTGEAAFAPYAYHYTPPLVQILAPLTLVLPAIAYIVGYRALEIVSVWYLAGRAMLPMLALIADIKRKTLTELLFFFAIFTCMILMRFGL